MPTTSRARQGPFVAVLAELVGDTQEHLHGAMLIAAVHGISPTSGSTPAALVNGAIDSFVRAVAFEVADGRRINAASPGWITDTLVQLGMDPEQGTPAGEVAELYVHALQSDLHGSVVAVGEGPGGVYQTPGISR